jgi:hypothetical protein
MLAARRSKFVELSGEDAFRPGGYVVPECGQLPLFESSDEQMRAEHFALVKKQ